MHLLYRSNNFWKAPWKSSCMSVSMTFVTASFISSIVSWWQHLSLGNYQKSKGARSGLWETEELYWYPSWSNSLGQGWRCGLVYYATQKLMLDSCKMVENQSETFHTLLWHFFPNLKRIFIAYCSSKVSDCIFEIHQLWQSGFSRVVYSNCCCSC